MGPMLLFDKSILQAISLDESVWLEQFFLINIVPTFYIEILADLEKEVSMGKSPDQIVGELAKKTPSAGTFSNLHHHTLTTNDLLGNKVDMSKRPFIRGGQPKITPDGKLVFFFSETPEDRTLKRWSKRQFMDIERDVAKQWRQALSGLTFETMIALIKNTVPTGTHFSNLDQIKVFVDKFIERNDRPVLDLALFMLDVPQKFQKFVIKRWEAESKPKLNVFAPYAAYVLSVDMLFYLALNSSFISKERPSNKIDLSYLYYLPFCMIFTSRDKLHRRLAPLFMKTGQVFAYGDDLKKGLKEIDDYFTKFKDKIDESGVMSFAQYPPQDADNYICKLWDSMGVKWRKDSNDLKLGQKVPQNKGLLEYLNKQQKHSKPILDPTGFSSDDADGVTFTRMVPVQKGKWRILPKGIEDKNK